MTAPRVHWTATDLMAAYFEPPKWAVPGILAEGINLLAGAPKVGKSWAALNIAVAVANGTEALDKVDVDQGDVLYLALEDTPRRVTESAPEGPARLDRPGPVDVRHRLPPDLRKGPRPD